ncbi:hypothetical protein DSCA_40500 [Desulfosarcina alkanivorans]|uniref:Uncharacterized protein n=1 Tax=Desulfosarcina alkanivorans TaxID=571177 RepID=A0A5K7YP80_9BACT|nr:hypothetical protein DSCA_40500 [Desulfosarcina alkanivorans]
MANVDQRPAEFMSKDYKMKKRYDRNKNAGYGQPSQQNAERFSGKMISPYIACCKNIIVIRR